MSFILTLACPDTVGIVAAVTGGLAAHGALITEAQHHREPLSNSTVLRIALETGGSASLDIKRLTCDFAAVANRFGMTWEIHGTAERLRVLVAVSKQGHCLKSLLHRWEVGTLPVDIVGVVSNHETQQRLVEWHGLPFHYLPIEPGWKEQLEEKLLALFTHLNADLLVLARLHADPDRQRVPPARRPRHQYPSLLFYRASRARTPTTMPMRAA